MLDVKIINSFFIFNKFIDQSIICFTFALLLVVLLKNKSRYLLPLFIIGVYLYSTIYGVYEPLNGIAILSFPLIISLIILGNAKKIHFICDGKTIFLFFNYFLLILIVVCIYSLFISSAKIFGFVSLDEFPRDYLYDVFVLISRPAPFLVILISVSLLSKVIYALLENRKLIRSIPSIKLFSESNSNNQKININFKINKRVSFIIILILGIIVPSIPQLPNINPENRYVGVDTFWYVIWTRPLNDASLFTVFKSAFIEQSHGDRPFSILIIFLVSKINPENIGDSIDYMPIFLTPITAIIVFFLTREIINRNSICFFASFFTIFSFQTLIGIYAGFYANWLGLIIGFLSLIFLFRFLKNQSKKNFILYSVIITSLVFFHVYTWAVYSAVIFIFLIAVLFLKFYQKKAIVFALVILGMTVAIDVSKDFAIGSSGGVREDVKLSGYYINLDNFSIFINNLYSSILISHGGVFGNGIVFSVVLLWALFYSNPKNPGELFLMIFFSILSILIFFGYWNIQVRVLYDIPVQVPFAISLFYIFKKTHNPLLLTAIVLILCSASIRELISFYLLE